MKSIMITGVAGLIGSRIADWLLKNQPQYEIIGIDNLSGGYKENIPDKVIFYNLDVASEDLKKVFEKHDVVYVYHLAAYAAEGLSPFIRKYNYNNNLIATANVVNECVRFGVKRLIFTSSLAVYGYGNPPFSEIDQPKPIDPYGVAKYACEMDIQIAGEQHQLDWCIIRPHNVYGINQNIWDKYRNVLGIWMYQKLNNQPFTIFGDGKQMRAFSYIDDCLEGFWKAAVDGNASREIINLGGIKETSVLEAAEILKEVVGGSDIQFLEGRHEVKYAYPTHQKSVDVLSYVEKTELKIGLSKMWEWAKVQPVRNQFKWDSYELDQGIYQYWK
ncbi:MAG: NAD-dependent epimerase/dehydratase family protein [Bacteroidetes bacterium]|nr:NAD-dependent epimerase/dehydratase family protein [Bacteroidota bacterium]MBU1372227.1 NAD-dependent epimerase/dehydratase family protein [Bacteroidota bacterium]MBU1484478.1 NAD-dependent epimerase/dehydratase family protein [Bacteroidota bacterium]MBU1760196.1 NAD-dependent epimerase/dehydratase family protein [Bacteroidota bacterium]MBU2045905.1 NAD-dependent epimerase/dehydratase family protein [Bacteroidota bacterium]